MSGFLYGNSVSEWKAVILFVLYIAHIFLMKYNHIYEVAIKKSVARKMEIKELNRIARSGVSQFHRNLQSRCYNIERLLRVRFDVSNDNYIEFENLNVRKKIKKITCVQYN